MKNIVQFFRIFPLNSPADPHPICPLVKMRGLSPQSRRCHVPETRRIWYQEMHPGLMARVQQLSPLRQRFFALVAPCHKWGKCNVCADMRDKSNTECKMRGFDGKRSSLPRKRQCA